MRQIFAYRADSGGGHQNCILAKVWVIRGYTSSLFYHPSDITLSLLIFAIQESIFKDEYEESHQNFYTHGIREWAHDNTSILCGCQSLFEPR